MQNSSLARAAPAEAQVGLILVDGTLASPTRVATARARARSARALWWVLLASKWPNLLELSAAEERLLPERSVSIGVFSSVQFGR